MQRIAGDDVAEDLFGSGKDGFQEAEPGIHGGTVVTADFLNAVQEEIARAIELAGITLDAGDDEQLWAAILQPTQGEISASAISSNVNDYAPTGLTTAAIVRVAASTSSNSITGLDATGLVTKVKRIVNTGSIALTLSHQSGSSAAANRFLCPGSTDYTLQGGEGVVVYHDGSRWRVLGWHPGKDRVLTGALSAPSMTLTSSTPVARLRSAWQAVLLDPSNFELNTDGLVFDAAGSYTAIWPLNGEIWDGSTLHSFALKFTFTGGSGTYTFSFFSYDSEYGDLQTHETVSLSTDAGVQEEPLTVSPAVDFSPDERLYFLSVAVAGSAGSPTDNFRVHSVKLNTIPAGVGPG